MYIFLQNYTTNQLGLFEDLRRLRDVKIVSQNRFDIYFQVICSRLGVATIPCIFLLNINLSKQHSFVLLPQVLSIWGTKWIHKIKNKNGVNHRFYLAMIDSIGASSPSMLSVIPLIESVKWDAIYTFDKEDSIKYGWYWLGLNYFSSPRFKTFIPSHINEIKTDAYFIGGMKGGRTELIIETANFLNKQGLNCKFELFTYGQSVVLWGGGAIRAYNI